MKRLMMSTPEIGSAGIFRIPNAMQAGIRSGLLGMGDKLFAVPWAALTLDTANKRFTLNVSKEVLKDAPGFDQKHWPSMSDKTWASGVHTYYGTPYRADQTH